MITFSLDALLQYLGLNFKNAESVAAFFSSQDLGSDKILGKCEGCNVNLDLMLWGTHFRHYLDFEFFSVSIIF